MLAVAISTLQTTDMNNDVEVRLARHAPPIARVIANSLKTASARSHIASLVAGMNGVFCLKSEHDAQHVTVSIRDGVINVKGGLDKRAVPVIIVDWNKMSSEGYEPRAEGVWRRPFFSLKVSKLMSEPPPNWADSAKRFWAVASKTAHTPERLVVTCPKEARSLTFGEGDSTVEIVGSATNLSDVFTGSAVLADSVATGKLQVHASLEHLAGLSDAGIDILCGEARG